MSFEIRDVETVYQGYSTLMKATIAAPDGSTFVREIEHHGDAVAVLPYDPQRGMVMLVRLPRPPVIWAGGPPEIAEAPAGMLDGDEPPQDAVRREVMEECGLKLEVLHPLGCVFSSGGVSAERVHLFLAAYSAGDRTGEGGGADGENENITVLEVPAWELWARLERGEILDMKTLLLTYALRRERPEMFEA